MALKVKAIERNISFTEGVQKWAYVLQADLYNKLNEKKVIKEAAIRANVSELVMDVAYNAISEVIKAWATEGHSVAIPGLGSMRFGLRSKSVDNVEDVSTDLIISRRVIFVPNQEIKDELSKTSITITCYDRDGEIVKRVHSEDDGDVEDNPEAQPKKLTLSSANPTMGSVTPDGETTHAAGEQVEIKAIANNGYHFVKWSDNDTNATRTITMSEDLTLSAEFAADGGGNPTGEDD